MEGKKSHPRALLVFGAPCSGKTTFCEKFAQKFNLGYFNLSEIRDEYSLSRDFILILIEQLAKTSHSLVFEGEIATEKERKEIIQILRTAGYSTAIVWIQTDVATIRSRLKMRHHSIQKAKAAYDAAVAELEAPSDLERPIILSGKHTFETQSKHVIAGLAR